MDLEIRKPSKVLKINCPNCGELQMKVFPWSSIMIPEGMAIPICKKCINKNIVKEKARVSSLKGRVA